MKTGSMPAKARRKTLETKAARPRMTRLLAEERAVGDAKAPKFDGVAFLRSLKK